MFASMVLDAGIGTITPMRSSLTGRPRSGIGLAQLRARLFRNKNDELALLHASVGSARQWISQALRRGPDQGERRNPCFYTAKNLYSLSM